MALIGKIVAITGNALLISNNGDQRELRLGDSIQTADTIKTLAGVEVELELANGRIVHIGAEQLVAFADELGDVFVPEASDSAIDVATIDTVIKAIEEGKDINEVLEDTAAGVGGTSNSYGFGFVDLLRINDDLNNFRFVFDSSTTGRLEAEPAVAVAETNTAEGVTVVATPTSLVSLSATPNVAEGGSIVYTVTLSNPVHTSPVDITLSNGLVISIPVGSATGSLSLAAPTDDVYLDASSISVSVTDAIGGDIALNINPASAVTVIDDTIDVTTVTLSSAAAGTAITEGGSIVYTASVNAPVTGSPLVITLSNSVTITIPVNASSADSASVAVRADDEFINGTDNLSVSILSTTGGNYEAIATTGTVTNTVVDDADPTIVSIAGVSSVTEGGDANYAITLLDAKEHTTDVVVTLAYSGTAINGVDFNGTTTVTILAGDDTGSLNISTIDDVLAEGVESFTITIVSAIGGGYENLVISPTQGSITTSILDNDPIPTISHIEPGAIGPGDDAVNEGVNLVYRVSVAGVSVNPTSFAFTLGGGTATVGTDYSNTPVFSNGVTYNAGTGLISVP
ncbi:MAG: retention module-containing protein, partial [Methylotenera sp.]|nr:retention module-containing protein [Methylotenera sp.]